MPALPSPSVRLLRAAAAEREDLERHRERLLAARDQVRAQLAQLEDALAEVDARAQLLDRLAEPPAQPDAPAPLRPQATATTPLRGPAIRRAAVRVVLEHPGRPQALHYRDWYEALSAAGHEISGKDPLAVFLTQLARSPVVRKGTQSGVYELDRGAPRRLRARLHELHDELRALTATPGSTVDLAAIRTRRAQLTVDIGRIEKALEEAEEVLSLEAALTGSGP